jgi:hypothetical protein
MLFEHGHGPAGVGQASSGGQAPGPATDDRYIEHVVTIIRRND